MIGSPEAAPAATARIPKIAAWRWPGLGGTLVVAASCMLLLLAADRIVRGVAAVVRPVEAMYGEAIIYAQAARLVRGEALYQPLDHLPFTVTAYTPLYYALVAGLQAVAGPGFGPGRLLSFGAGLVAAILVGRLAARRVDDWRGGLFASVLFVALAFPGDFPWFAFYKEDMLGVALSLGAIAVLDSRCDRGGAVAAGALAGFAFLSKQTFVAAGVAGFWWLWRRDRTSALLFATAFLIVGVAPCVVAALSTDAFVDNTIRANLNPSSRDILADNLAIFGRYQEAALVLALVPIVSRAHGLRSWLRDPVVLFWMVSLVLLPVELAKVGSNWNYWIEAAAASAVLATQGVWVLVLKSGASRLGRVGAAVALLGILASPTYLPAPSAGLGTVLDRTLHPDQRQATAFAAVLERVRTEPRGVLSEPLDVVVLAGRPIIFEPFIFSILDEQGRWDPVPLVRDICAGRIGLLVLDHRLDGPDWETQGYHHWSGAVLDALRDTTHLEREQASLFLYVPGDAQQSDVAACRGVA